MLVRNEAGPDRYLGRILARLKDFTDTIVVLDDRSSDETPKICENAGAIVRVREAATAAWGTESTARQELWDLAVSHASGPNDWILICDADMEFVGNPRELCLSREVNSWATVLYDAWSDTEYRADEFWVGHKTPRVWLVAPQRVPSGWRAEWTGRGIHVGHLPANWPSVAAVAPPDQYYWLHLAYRDPGHRAKKLEQYRSQFHLMSDFERRHAESILH